MNSLLLHILLLNVLAYNDICEVNSSAFAEIDFTGIMFDNEPSFGECTMLKFALLNCQATGRIQFHSVMSLTSEIGSQ